MNHSVAIFNRYAIHSDVTRVHQLVQKTRRGMFKQPIDFNKPSVITFR